MTTSLNEVEHRITDLVRAIVTCDEYPSVHRSVELPEGIHGVVHIDVDGTDGVINLKMEIEIDGCNE